MAKAHADIILVSGHEGGTGASPLSSVKNAGGAWEMGVAESHQVLLLNGLRNRVTLRTDGGMRSGEDIVYATLLGAEEYNFGTAALIAMGCVYVRQCHLNTCPVGVATLDEKLRGKFKGKPENVVTFFNAVAAEVREIMARLGFQDNQRDGGAHGMPSATGSSGPPEGQHAETCTATGRRCKGRLNHDSPRDSRAQRRTG